MTSGASGKASYFITAQLTSMPQLHSTRACFLANPLYPKLNDISWRGLGKQLEISQELLHSTPNAPLRSITQLLPGSINWSCSGATLWVWSSAIWNRSVRGCVTLVFGLNFPSVWFPISNLFFPLLYAFFELISSLIPNQSLPILPLSPSRSHSAAGTISFKCWCDLVALLFRILCNSF